MPAGTFLSSPMARSHGHPERDEVIFSEARYASACSNPPREWEEEIALFVLDKSADRSSGEIFMRWYRLKGVLSPRLEISPDGWRVLANLTPSLLEELGQLDNQDTSPTFFREVLDRCGFVDAMPREWDTPPTAGGLRKHGKKVR